MVLLEKIQNQYGGDAVVTWEPVRNGYAARQARRGSQAKRPRGEGAGLTTEGGCSAPTPLSVDVRSRDPMVHGVVVTASTALTLSLSDTGAGGSLN